MDLSEWVKSGMWLERHPFVKREPDFVVEDNEAGFWLEGWFTNESEAGYGAGPALYRGAGGRMLSAQDIRNFKHLKLIAGGDGRGISS